MALVLLKFNDVNVRRQGIEVLSDANAVFRTIRDDGFSHDRSRSPADRMRKRMSDLRLAIELHLLNCFNYTSHAEQAFDRTRRRCYSFCTTTQIVTTIKFELFAIQKHDCYGIAGLNSSILN